MAQLIGIGRLGQDAETRHTPGGDAVTSLSLAFAYGKKQDGEKYRPSQWVRATIWGQRGENIAPYLTKGKLVYVVLDDVHVREWEKDGKSGSSLEGRVATIEFAGGGEDRQESAPAERTRQAPAPKPAAGGGSMADMDDDIPFSSRSYRSHDG